MTKSVSILMGSESDREIAKKAETILDKLGVPYETKVLSSHRNHKEASLSMKPVIGVPVSGKLNLDSILAIVQLPSGVPVGTVGLDNGTNAGLLAAQILALSDLEISKKLTLYRSGQL